MKKEQATLLCVFVVFLALAFLMGKVYQTGVNRPPLKYALIPDGTLNYLKHLSELGGEGGGIIVRERGSGEEWSNKKDLGSREKTGWSKEEDDNFIVYYHRDKEALWQGRALNVLRCANQNIEPLAELMGRYIYPAEVNGRKLSIYLPQTDGEYISLQESMLQKKLKYDTSIGVTITTISVYGCKTEGILLRPSCFTQNQYSSVLLHEMNHYVYRSSIDYSKEIDCKKWQLEGTADFNSGEDKGILYTAEEKAECIEKYCFLNKEFPNKDNMCYWAGKSFLEYVESTYGRDKVKAMIQESYAKTTADVFASMGWSEEEEHIKWVEFVRSGRENPVQ